MPSQLLSLLLLGAGVSQVHASCAYGTHLHRRQENGAVKVNNFSYKGATGPLNWVALDPAANAACAAGTSQSPIDMVDGQFTLVPASAINLQVADVQQTEFENLGTTVEVIMPAGAGSINLNGNAFELKQFHFHHPSEHLDAGSSLALEMHMVFESAAKEISVVGVYFDPVEGGQVANGAPPPGAAAPPAAARPAAAERRHARDTHAHSARDVDAEALDKIKRQIQVINGNGQINPQTAALLAQLLAIMQQQGAQPGQQQGAQPIVVNPGAGNNVLLPGAGAGAGTGAGRGVSQQTTGGTQLLDTVFASVGAIATPGTKVAIGPLNMAPLIQSLNQGTFQNYKGSLTTPPCSEGVNWFVSTQKQTVSLAALAAVQGVVGFNSRFPQNTLGQENVLAIAARTSAGGAAAPPVAAPIAVPAAGNRTAARSQ